MTMPSFVFRPSPPPDGVRIPLRPLSTQLVFTVIMALSECLFVSSFLVLHAYGECRVLAREKLLSVKSHVRRIKMFHLLALAMFFSLEVLISFYSEEYDRPINSNQDCLTIKENRSTKFSEKDFDMEMKYSTEKGSVVYGCLQIKKDQTYLFTEGSFSLEHQTVQCSEGPPLFTYHAATFVNETAEGRQWYSHCNDGACFGMFSEGKNVFFSLPHKTNHNFSEKITDGLWSSLRYDPSPFLEGMVVALTMTFRKGETDELHLRHKIFTEVKEEQCNMFTSLRRETVLPFSIVIVAASLWILSVFMFLITRFLKKSVFYDMHDPLHWAKNNSGSLNEPEKDETVHIKLCGQGDHGQVVVSYKTKAKKPDAGYHDNSEFQGAHQSC